MALMPAQFLKGGKSYMPVEVKISDRREYPSSFLSPMKTKYNRIHNIEYTLNCRTIDKLYECKKCNTNPIHRHGETGKCLRCDTQMRVKTLTEGRERQELMLDQKESEYLLEGLIIKTGSNIDLEVKLKLIKLLSIETKKEMLDYLVNKE
tara:strand:+ start:114 stop:563 length:450 start_codon:yes stop_codon:yes gene_type:complete